MGPLPLTTSEGTNTFVRITEPRTSVLQIRASETATLHVAICGSCGYAEQSVADAARLWKYWQKGYR
ncbi:hypothetical protein M0L20_08460 [Spirosoma sp. RP8]|uniref:Uncharacterized protein n=1 Tax=Spirosoma liriopis TaxID=2937440 RepID=A0ABT0HI86_9BACT|nr:hypothetical protein [Spirosoma liriopis]MCK8491878.1 hypothetical protein [Spirosoma liriopis]